MRSIQRQMFDEEDAALREQEEASERSARRFDAALRDLERAAERTADRVREQRLLRKFADDATLTTPSQAHHQSRPTSVKPARPTAAEAPPTERRQRTRAQKLRLLLLLLALLCSAGILLFQWLGLP